MKSDYYDLGAHSWPITTISPEAQRWFDRGLNWTYGFNHLEAVRCFERALDHDDTCPMARWGIAFASGPNYNKGWERFDEKSLRETVAFTYEATQRALDLLDYASPLERALIETLTSRYPSPTPAADYQELYDEYADAMRRVYRQSGDDLDVATLFADALMCRAPWQLWDLKTGEVKPDASTVEAAQVLERALERRDGQRHPGITHMYIHLMEMSPHPEKALMAADWLRGLVPEAGHMEHMPSHIDVLCGHYANVVTSNHDAVIADEKFVEREGRMNYYTLYRVHNYHFKIYGAMFLGQYQTAIDTATQLIDTIPIELLKWESPPMATWLESFMPMRLHVLMRFGKWQEIIDTELPDDRDLFMVTVATIHYARGVAHAATGRVNEAEEERRRFRDAHDRIPEEARYLHNNSCRHILNIASAMLDGELEYRKGNYGVAFEHLRRAIYLEDNLEYDEPWSWMQPTRHALGALLLEQGHVEEAADVYRADLGLDDSLPRACQHPENVWALHGYHECLVRLNRNEEARLIRQRLELAAARADVPIVASCLCRTSEVASGQSFTMRP